MRLPDDYEYRSCIGKVRYGSGAEAAEARRRMRSKPHRKSGKGRGDLNIYKCEFCKGHHLGRPTEFRG